jgi:hypothetical protein
MAYVAMSETEEAENLSQTVTMLNDKSTTRLEDWRNKNWSYNDAVWLRRMVRDWIDAGRGLGRIHLEPKERDRERLEKFTERIRVTIDGSVFDFYDRDTAAKNFTRLIRNSRQSLLREPCLNCGLWYVAKTEKKTDYCSHKCAGNAAHAAKRKREHDRKREKAQKAIGTYLDRPPRFAKMNWKQYVSEATGVSKKFLTVAVRNGELMEPDPIPHREEFKEGKAEL